MSRNANLDKAKRQAVGIYRAASPHASINHGAAQYSGGDYRVPEAAKTCYLALDKRADANLVSAFLAANGAKKCKSFINSSGRKVASPTLNRSGTRATPQTRGELIPGNATRGLPIQQSNPAIFPYTVEVARLLRK